MGTTTMPSEIQLRLVEMAWDLAKQLDSGRTSDEAGIERRVSLFGLAYAGLVEYQDAAIDSSINGRINPLTKKDWSVV